MKKDNTIGTELGRLRHSLWMPKYSILKVLSSTLHFCKQKEEALMNNLNVEALEKEGGQAELVMVN